ncbi:MAG: hypothetical protein LBQ81_05610 [Zoogloeaceae bacterium]|nr:hypothetical protein [Zoogloeaceae bacterium]
MYKKPFFLLCTLLSLMTAPVFADDQIDRATTENDWASRWLDVLKKTYGAEDQVSDSTEKENTLVEDPQTQAENRKRFYEFCNKNGIDAWIPADQWYGIYPYWKGKTVGLIVRLNRMTTRDSALIQPAAPRVTQDLQLTGVTPDDFPDDQHSILLVAKVHDSREPLPNIYDSLLFTTLSRIDSRVCEQRDCRDWLMGISDQEINWGKPFSPR